MTSKPNMGDEEERHDDPLHHHHQQQTTSVVVGEASSRSSFKMKESTEDINEIALFGNSHHLDDEPESATSETTTASKFSSTRSCFLERRQHHLVTCSESTTTTNTTNTTTTNNTNTTPHHHHFHQQQQIGRFSNRDFELRHLETVFQKGTNELEGENTSWCIEIQNKTSPMEDCKWSSIATAKQQPIPSKIPTTRVEFKKHVFLIGKRNCSILLTCLPLCICWVFVMSVLLYCMTSLFIYWTNMPYDPTKKCTALYQSQHDLFVSKLVTMNDIDLEQEKTFFVTSRDFLNTTSLSSYQHFLQTENAPYNQLSRLMTHNSYHRKKMFFSSFISQFNYEHDALETQLEGHVRGLELDVHYNKRTGRFQVYHIPVLDDNSSCDCFLSCLLLIKRWMKRQEEKTTRSLSNHTNGSLLLPDILTIYIEPKYLRDIYQFCGDKVPSVFPDLINEILRVFPLERILTPAKLKGNYTSVRAAIHDRGWPLRDSIRGMVMFVLNLWEENKACYSEMRIENSSINPTDVLFYRDHFKNMQQPNNDAVFFEVDDARPFLNLTSHKPMLSDGGGEIDTLILQDEKFVIPGIISRNVQKGLIIRCTTGGPNELTGKAIRQQSSKINTKYSSFTQSEACMRSGAQLINTDYPNSAIFKTLFANETFLNPLFYDMKFAR